MPEIKAAQAELAPTKEALERPDEIRIAASAHDLNNLLQVISGNLDLALRLIARQPATDERMHEQLFAAITRAQRSTEALAAAIQRTIDAG